MQHRLSPLFEPRSIAVFGASERPGAVGTQVVDNLLSSGFLGPLHFINPRHTEVRGRRCIKTLAETGTPIDLAVIATPPSTILELVRACASQSVRAMVVMTAGFGEVGAEGARLEQELVRRTQESGILLLGPNCLGVLSTGSKMNATFANVEVRPGSLALVSQSGALCTAMLDWAQDMPFGFSNVVSMGDAAGVGFGDVLDYLAMDARTQAILLYVEGVRDARQFMSGLRVAARLKPTVVLKAGKHTSGAKAAQTHTGSIVGSDDVFGAALRRAGAVRVDTIGQLFATAELLGSGHRFAGDSLTIVTNAGGPGVMSADRCAEVGVKLAPLSGATLQQLRESLEGRCSGENPVDVLGDAGPERYRVALTICLADPATDGVVVMLTPQAMTNPTECARMLVEVAKGERKPLVACFMGGRQVEPGRELLRRNGVPVFDTPEASIDAFRRLWAYRQNQELLVQSVSPMSYVARHDAVGARLIVQAALEAKRQVLDSTRSKAVLSAFGIPCSMPIIARNVDEALVAAENLGFPVVLKINSPDITHKSDVGGVRVGIASGDQVCAAFSSILQQARAAAPEARFDGVTVEKMLTTPAREVMVGVVRDPSFGPAISVGAGGVLVELIADKSVGLPPLNPFMAHDMIQRTALNRLLSPFRGHPGVAVDAIAETLCKVSDLVSELSEVVSLDINPLLVTADGVLAVDARIVVERRHSGTRPYAHMAVHPYPAFLTKRDQLSDGTPLLIRPIRPEDAQIEQAFVRGLSEQSRYFRFMRGIVELTPEMLTRFTQLDYDREMAFIAVVAAPEGSTPREAEIGVSRYVTNPDGKSAEFALVVADEWQGRGVGSRLMQALFSAARAQGLTTLEGEILEVNHPMLRLVTELGFTTEAADDDPTLRRAVKVL